MTELPIIADPSAPSERDSRVTTILLVGRISTATRDDLCRVRNISAGGMRIETLAPFDVGQEVEIELKNGMTMRSEVVWLRPTEAGIRFCDPVNIEQLLAPAAPAARTARVGRAMGPQAMRSPRLSARCPVAMRHEGRIMAAMLIDISQGGAQLVIRAPIKISDQLVLFVPGFGSCRASVQWVRSDNIGVGFAEKLGFAELAKWLAGPDRFLPALVDAVSSPSQSS